MGSGNKGWATLFKPGDFNHIERNKLYARVFITDIKFGCYIRKEEHVPSHLKSRGRIFCPGHADTLEASVRTGTDAMT